MASVAIRLLRTHEEFRECERIQNAVWGTIGASGEVMTVTQKYGGAVLGAFVNRRIVGFIYAFLAERRGRLIHWSHMMAVDSAFRDRGLGWRMKLAHRRFALERSIRTICWTYDPLQSRNATLNLHSLGARPEEYIPDCYGQFPSRIERGLPSDRFVVNWRIASPEVTRRLRGWRPRLDSASFPVVNSTRLNARGFLVVGALRLDRRQSRLLFEIPANTDEMRAKALPLARRWRLATRTVLQSYLAAGYEVADFIPPGPATRGRCFYLLRRRLKPGAD